MLPRCPALCRLTKRQQLHYWCCYCVQTKYFRHFSAVSSRAPRQGMSPYIPWLAPLLSPPIYNVSPGAELQTGATNNQQYHCPAAPLCWWIVVVVWIFACVRPPSAHLRDFFPRMKVKLARVTMDWWQSRISALSIPAQPRLLLIILVVTSPPAAVLLSTVCPGVVMIVAWVGPRSDQRPARQWSPVTALYSSSYNLLSRPRQGGKFNVAACIVCQHRARQP